MDQDYHLSLKLPDNFEQICLSYKNESITRILNFSGTCHPTLKEDQDKVRNSHHEKGLQKRSYITPKTKMKSSQNQDPNINFQLTRKKEQMQSIKESKDQQIMEEFDDQIGLSNNLQIMQAKCTKTSIHSKKNFEGDQQLDIQISQIDFDIDQHTHKFEDQGEELSIVEPQEGQQETSYSDLLKLKEIQQCQQENKLDDVNCNSQSVIQQSRIRGDEKLFFKNYSLSENTKLENKLTFNQTQPQNKELEKTKENFQQLKFRQPFCFNQTDVEIKSEDKDSIEEVDKSLEMDENRKENDDQKNLSGTKNRLEKRNPPAKSIFQNQKLQFDFFKNTQPTKEDHEEKQKSKDKKGLFQSSFGCKGIFSSNFFKKEPRQKAPETSVEQNTSKISRSSRKIRIEDYGDTESYQKLVYE